MALVIRDPLMGGNAAVNDDEIVVAEQESKYEGVVHEGKYDPFYSLSDVSHEVETAQKLFLPTDRFLSSWHFYHKLLVNPLDSTRQQEIRLFLPRKRSELTEYSVLKAFDEEKEALLASKRQELIFYLQNNNITLPANASTADIQHALKTHFSTEITAVQPAKDEQEAGRISARFYFYSIGNRSAQYMKLDELKESIKNRLQDLHKFQAPGSFTRSCFELLSVYSRHPTIAFLTQCAVDEICSAQAEAFLGDKSTASVHDTLGAALLVYMFRQAHDLKSDSTTIFSRSTAVPNEFVRALFRWHLLMLSSDYNTEKSLIGYMPREQVLELSRLFEDDVVQYVCVPEIAASLAAQKELVPTASPLTSVAMMVTAVQEYIARRMPQLNMAFPHLATFHQSTSSLVYFPSALTCKVVDITSGISLALNNSDCLKKMLVPEFHTEDNHAKHSYELQQKVFNQTRVDSGFRILNRLYGLPLLIGVRSKNVVAGDEVVRIGPCLETGRYGYYTPFALYTENQSFVSVRTKIDDLAHLSILRLTDIDRSSSTAAASAAASESYIIYERIDATVDK